jgi:hypothetical protein
VLNLAIFDAMKNFWIQARVWGDDEDSGVSVEKVQDPTSSNLEIKSVRYRQR